MCAETSPVPYAAKAQTLQRNYKTNLSALPLGAAPLSVGVRTVLCIDGEL